jgi:hypothetical protein
MIIVIKKADYSCQPFSTLRLAFEAYKNEFEYKLGTLEKEKFPVILKDYVLEKRNLIKKKYVKTNFY